MSNRGAAILDWALVALMIVVGFQITIRANHYSMTDSSVSSRSGS